MNNKRQAAWYSLALSYMFKEASILPFMFLVESTTVPGEPVQYVLNSRTLALGKTGAPAVEVEDSVVIPEIKGYEQLLTKYLYHKENEFKLERILSEAEENPIILDWDGVVGIKNF